jgi:hypothetical protein
VVALAVAWGLFSGLPRALSADVAEAVTQDGERGTQELSGSPLAGVLRERGTREPIAGASVFILPHRLKAVTDSAGAFRFDAVPAGDYRVVVNLAGYERLERPGSQGAAEGPVLSLFLERSSYLAYETTVYGKEKKRDDSTRSLGRKEFTQAGAGGDPVRAVQNLPGVNRAAGLSSQIVIQGSAPNQTRYLIEGHEVPIIFHFGGLSSVVMPEALERVDYLSAGYGPEFGRALGGLVGVYTRSPRKDRFRGFGFVDILNAGAQLEGPIGPDGKGGAFMLSARQSYIGSVLRAVTRDNEDFSLTVAPEFRDLSGVYEIPLGDRADFKLTAVGSDDTLEFLLAEPAMGDPAVRGAFSNRTWFYRWIPQLTYRHGEGTVSRWSLAMGRDSIRFNVGEDFLRIGNTQLTARGELERRSAKNWVNYWGFDNRYRWANVDLRLPTVFGDGGITNPISSGVTREREVRSKFNDVGVYWRSVLGGEGPGWTWMPAVRGEYSSQTREFFAMPRLAVRYTASDSLSVRGAGGLYYQPPQEGETDAEVGNPELRAPRAWHAAAGVERDFRGGKAEGWTATSGLFYRGFERLVIPSNRLISRGGVTAPEYYTNDGSGRAFGAEALVRYQDRKWSGWLAYTVSRSTRWDPARAEYVFPFDQTHLLTALGSLDLRGNWRLSSRLRYVTGNPTTPVLGGVFDADNDVYIPQRGVLYSERLEPFFQLDLRVDKRFVTDRMIWSVYLELLNATNRANPEAIRYSYDYRVSEKVRGLPVVPLLGVKGEF